MRRLLSALRRLAYMDWGMAAVTLLLLALGIFFVYSACFVSDELPVRSLYRKQIMWVIVGCIAHAGFAAMDYRSLQRYAWWIYGASLALLVMVLLFGTRIYGARRWLMFFDVGIQPSELAKVATVLVLARVMGRPGADLRPFRMFLRLLAIAAIGVALILRQPDLGTAMIFAPTTVLMMFVAGIPMRWLGGLVGAGALAVALLLGALLLPARLGASEAAQQRWQDLTFLSDYQRDRIVVFFEADADPLGAGWNKRQSEIAVGSGGAWGKGFLKGTQNILGFLPRSVAPTDFIYSVIAEEKGFFGSSVVLGLFTVLIALGLRTAYTAPDAGGRLICVGLMSLIFCHVFINIAMTVGLMPITGLPLPLLSYGGSFMIVTMSALGIVQSIYIRSRRTETFRAAHVSGTRHVSSVKSL
jgi:rod shape determining protein RodA